MNWSIERRPPLLVSVLLLAVAGALLLIGFAEVRRAARGLADARLVHADSALADLFQNSMLSSRLTGLARDSALRAVLRGGGRRDPALAAMRRIVNDTSSSAALQLWDSAGRLVLHTGRFAAEPVAPQPPASDSVQIGPLLRRDTTLFYRAAAAVRQDGRLLGTVQQVSRINLNERTRRTLTGLGGGEVALLLGNAAGDPWTDFATIIPAPPDFVRSSTQPATYERGEPKRASARLVPGTPWMVIAELPRRVIVAPARHYLVRMIPIAVAVVLIGALTAWWGSRRISGPLREVTRTAEAIAAGDMERRVPAAGPHEVRSLARSFNTMTEQVARSLQSKDTLIKGVTETAHDAIIAADAEGRIRFWNPGANRIFGYAAEEVVGKPLTILMPERFHELHRSGIQRYVATREPRVVGKTVELEGRRKDGSEFPIELSLGAASLGGSLTFTGVIRDITERKRIDQALQTTNAELESFSYSVSHDLRAPLRAIHGFARILLEDHHAKLDPEAQRLLGVIDQNTRRMGQLIDDLLAFSRLGRKELETRHVDMGELARGIADEVRRAEGDRPLEITVAPLPPAEGDRALLRQVMSNLVQNAAKFTRGKSDARIEVGAERNGNQSTYYVKDNGAGFDPRYADKLFGVFQRLHRAEEFEGTGVGLAIVKRIVQRHGGRVWADSKMNEGATFYFTLPMSEA